MGVKLGLPLTKERRLRVFENMMLRKLFGPKRDEVTGGWRKLHKEGLNLYSSPNIILVIQSRRMRWAGLVARVGHRRDAYGFWWGNLRKRDHFEEVGVDGKMILKWIFKKWNEES